GPDSVRDPGRHHHPDIISARMIVAVDEETHRPAGKSGADIVEDHFRDALHEKHHIPLFFGVLAQRDILRLLDEQPAHPLVGFRSLWDARRMHMETFRGLREHPGICPLSRPQSDPLKDAFITPDELGEKAAMPLAMHRYR